MTLLSIAAAAEARSTYPLAQTMLDEVERRGLPNDLRVEGKTVMLRALHLTQNRFEPVHCSICGQPGRVSKALAAGPLSTMVIFICPRWHEPAQVGIADACSPDSGELCAQPTQSSKPRA